MRKIQKRRVSVGGLLLLFALCLTCPGCQIFHRYRPVVVQVRDAETKKPILGVEVDISYPLEHPPFGPSGSRGTTDGEGIARLRAAPSKGGIDVGVNAPGYMADEQFVSGKDVEALDPSHLFEAVERRPVTLVLEMYAVLPHPRVELVLPAGYRGLVKVKLEVAEGVPCTPGQRHFTHPVPITGIVEAKVPPVFRHFTLPDIIGRYPDGTQLTAAAKNEQVGFWWLRSEGNVHTYLVGLESEYARQRPAASEGGRVKPSGGGGKKGGRGRGGKGGGSQQPDSGSGGMNP
jgi:hypothetical protein